MVKTTPKTSFANAFICFLFVCTFPHIGHGQKPQQRQNNGRQVEKINARNTRTPKSDNAAFHSFEKTKLKHLRRNQEKTLMFLKRFPNIKVKRKTQWIRRSEDRTEYEIISFGNKKIDRFLSKLKYIYEKSGKELPRFELITNRKSRTYASASHDSAVVHFSFAALERVEKGGLMAFVHEMRHIGNQNLIFRTEFQSSPRQQFRFEEKHLNKRWFYDNYFSAEELNNYWRWNKQHQRAAKTLYLRVFGIHREIKKRLQQVDDFQEFLAVPDKFYGQGHVLFETSHALSIGHFYSGLPEHYVTRLSIPNFELETGVLTERRRAPLYRTPKDAGATVSVELPSLKKPSKDPLKHLLESVELLEELMLESRKLARKRRPRNKPDI